MFQLNPLDLSVAWWQYLLMLLISGIIGGVIGFTSREALISQLVGCLIWTEANLEKCARELVPTVGVASVITDDFKVIEGIGNQTEKLLHKAGIRTYTHLSLISPVRIKEILDTSGSRFQMHDPETWPRQASLAASRNWSELKRWKDTLDGDKA